jgi:hypothetical protein
MKNILLWILIATNILSVMAIVVLYSSDKDGKMNRDTTVLPSISPARLPLPTDAVKISECIPFMGEHWVQPSKLPVGPIYAFYNGKVTAIEYMFTPDKIPGEKAAKMSQKDADDFIRKNNLSLADLVNANKFDLDLPESPYTFLTLDWSSPHSGLAAPHYDLHAYLIPKSERDAICPEAKLEEVYSTEVMDNIQKYKIPFPSVTSGNK